MSKLSLIIRDRVNWNHFKRKKSYVTLVSEAPMVGDISEGS